MATREERTLAYNSVVNALIQAAAMDGFMERVAIAKAMDALGPILSDIALVVRKAIAFRNGPLLRDHQPVNTYLQRDDPRPVVWSFTTEEILGLRSGSMTTAVHLIDEAYHRVHDQMPAALMGFHPHHWEGEVERDGDNFVVTLYPDRQTAKEDDELRPEQPKTPSTQLPTILIEFEELLGWVDCSDTVELQIIDHARYRLAADKPEKFAKLTHSWWAKVEVTDIGYLVTFHYDKEMP